MKITRTDLQQKNAELDYFGLNGKYTSAMNELIVSNKFKMKRHIDEINDYAKLIRDSWLKDNKKDESCMTEGSEDVTKFTDFLDNHGEFQAFMKVEVNVSFSTFSVKNLRSCSYNPTLAFTLNPQMFVDENDKKVKATAG